MNTPAVLLAGWLFFQPPPPDYRGEGVFLVRIVPRAAIERECAGAPTTWLTDRVFGCTRGIVIIMPNPCEWPGQDPYAQLFCHEKGHALGWRH